MRVLEMEFVPLGYTKRSGQTSDRKILFKTNKRKIKVPKCSRIMETGELNIRVGGKKFEKNLIFLPAEK